MSGRPLSPAGPSEGNPCDTAHNVRGHCCSWQLAECGGLALHNSRARGGARPAAPGRARLATGWRARGWLRPVARSNLPQAHGKNVFAPHRRGGHACRLTVLADSLTKSAFPIDKSVQHATTGNFIMDIFPLLTMWVAAGGARGGQARRGGGHSAVRLPGVAWQGCRFWVCCPRAGAAARVWKVCVPVWGAPATRAGGHSPHPRAPRPAPAGFPPCPP